MTAGLQGQDNFAGLRLQHWRTEPRADGVLVLVFDRAGSPVNTFGQDVLIELDGLLERIAIDPPKGLVVRSGKDKGFIAGADIKEFQTFDEKGVVGDAISRGQRVFQRLAELPCPTVAAIHGFCMGGGTEIALACRYRVASNDASTRIGLPEVKLGIYPGWGGSVRLPRLVGAPAAFDLMLTGRSLSASAARAMGLVDKVVDPAQLIEAAAALALRGTQRPFKQRAMAWATNTLPARKLLAPMLAKQVARKARKEHYPAPFALISTWERAGGGVKSLLAAERKSVVKLASTPTARNLIRVFFLQEEHPDQVARGRRRSQLDHRLALGRQQRLDAATRAFPRGDQRERCRVVLLAGLARHLLGQHRRQQLARGQGVGGPRHGTLLERALRAAQGQCGGRFDQLCRIDHLVYQPHGAGGRGRQRAASQHQVECRRRTHQARQAHAAAPARVDAQLHFRQADAGGGIIAGHAVAAGQRDFGAAAHAEAVNGRDRGAGQLGQALEHALAAADRITHHALLVEGLEFLDVGAGNEPLVLARPDDEALGRVDGDPFQQAVQFDQHVLAEGVDRRPGPIEHQHQHAVGARLGAPVLQAQPGEVVLSLEASGHSGNHPFTYGGSAYHPEDLRPQSNGRLEARGGAGHEVAKPGLGRAARGRPCSFVRPA